MTQLVDTKTPKSRLKSTSERALREASSAWARSPLPRAARVCNEMGGERTQSPHSLPEAPSGPASVHRLDS